MLLQLCFLDALGVKYSVAPRVVEAFPVEHDMEEKRREEEEDEEGCREERNMQQQRTQQPIFHAGRTRTPEILILERQPDKLLNTLINSDGLQFWHHISFHSELDHLCNWCSRVDVLHVARRRNASRTHDRLPDCVSMRVHEPQSDDHAPSNFKFEGLTGRRS